MSNPYKIRWLIRRDMERVLEIESEEQIDRFDEEQFLAHLRMRNCIPMVCTDAGIDNQVFGYMLYELHEGFVRVIKFRVAESDSGNGYGSGMVLTLIVRLVQQHRTAIKMEVYERRDDFLMFLKSQGFKAVGISGDHIEMEYSICEPKQEFVNRISQHMEGDAQC